MNTTQARRNNKPVALIGIICLLSAMVCGASGIFAAVTYSQNWFRPAAWIKLSQIFNYSMSRVGMVAGVLIGLATGYLWCRFINYRGAKYRDLPNPRYGILVREGVAMGITMGWLGGVVMLVCLHAWAPNPLDARALFTYVPIAIAMAIFGGLGMGLLGSVLWWGFEMRKKRS